MWLAFSGRPVSTSMLMNSSVLYRKWGLICSVSSCIRAANFSCSVRRMSSICCWMVCSIPHSARSSWPISSARPGKARAPSYRFCSIRRTVCIRVRSGWVVSEEMTPQASVTAATADTEISKSSW